MIDGRSLRALRGRLEAAGYPLALGALQDLRQLGNPWPAFDDARAVTAAWRPEVRVPLRLFALGLAEDRDEVARILGFAVFDALLEHGLLVEHDAGVSTHGRAVLVHEGLYVVADIPWFYPTAAHRTRAVYLSADTIQLCRYATGSVGRVFEVCAGSGLAGLVAARTALAVTTSDVDESACAAQAANAVANDLTLDVRRGDLFEPVADERYDRILANPPNIPIPEAVTYSVAGDGGADGARLVRAVAQQALDHLVDGGELSMVCQVLGDDAGPFLGTELERLVATRGGDATFVTYARIPMILRDAFSLTLASRFNPKHQRSALVAAYRGLRERLGASFMYQAVIRWRRGGIGRLRTLSLHSPWTLSDCPAPVAGAPDAALLFAALATPEGAVTRFPIDGGPPDLIDRLHGDVAAFFTLCDGRRRIDGIATELAGDEGPYCGQLAAILLAVCEVAVRRGQLAPLGPHPFHGP